MESTAQVEEQAQDRKIAKEAIAYLEANSLVVEISFPDSAPPSKEVDDFLFEYLETALHECDDVASSVIEEVRSNYPE